MPRVTAEAEKDSLAVHSRYFQYSRQEFREITDYERMLTLQVCERAYEKARYNLPADFLSRDSYYRAVRQLEFTSSPGYPYCKENSSIGGWLGWNGVTFSEEKLEQLWHDLQAFQDGRLESLYRVFVKSEPHTKAKAALSRWRLIICPPLFEQVMWVMVFAAGNDVEVKRVRQTPSMQGMKLCGGEWKLHSKYFRARGYDAGLDKSAWDWTCHRELLRLDLDLRERLITSSPEQRARWRVVAERLYEGAFDHPRLVFSDGSVYEQLYPGIMKSGCVNTISTNSHCQVFVHVLAALRQGLPVGPLPVAVGDDTLGCASNTPTADYYRTVGVVLKDVAGLQFVGHHWREGGPEPAYTAKHMYRFLTVAKEFVGDFLESMVLLYAHGTAVQRVWYGLGAVLGHSLPSEAYVRFWYDWGDDVGIWAL